MALGNDVGDANDFEDGAHWAARDDAGSLGSWRHHDIGGAVVTESVFAIPGVGRLVVDAILRRDYPVIQGVVLMFSFTYVIVNLIVDLLYTVFDPRIRY